MVVLDTDHLSLLEWTNSPTAKKLMERLASVGSDNTFATIVSYEEQIRGWMSKLGKTKSVGEQIEAYRRLKQQLENYCSVSMLEFDERAAVEFQSLKRTKIKVATMDLKIAAIVIARKATLLSRNLSDFSQIPGLMVEDWTK